MSDYLSNYITFGNASVTTNAASIVTNYNCGQLFSQLGLQQLQQQAQHAAAIQQKAKPVPAAVVRDDEFAWLRGRVAELCWKAA